jgi:hypothetical protein
MRSIPILGRPAGAILPLLFALPSSGRAGELLAEAVISNFFIIRTDHGASKIE